MSNRSPESIILSPSSLRYDDRPVVSEGFQHNARKDQDVRRFDGLVEEQIEWLKKLGFWIKMKRTDIAIKKVGCQLVQLECQKKKLMIHQALWNH